ncbi:DNA mismatch endonuclease Vsr [Phaeobacter inhibens]|nr:DNA mismatch endonuclease Vsr [Phaeobacter inhibens]
MADIVTPEVRSRMMAANRRRDTKPEMIVRRDLHRHGFRFRLDVRKLPGSPDIVLARHRAAIFVHGCYWHRHPGCKLATTPKTRVAFWEQKFTRNVERDRAAVVSLQELGWRVAIVWECALRKDLREASLFALREWLRGSSALVTVGGQIDS